MACGRERQPFLDDDTNAMIADFSRSLDARNTRLHRRRYKDIVSEQANCLRNRLKESTPATPKASKSQRSGRGRPCASPCSPNVNSRSRNFYDAPPSIFEPQATSTLRNIHEEVRRTPAPCFSSSEPDVECERPSPAVNTGIVAGEECPEQRTAPGPCSGASLRSCKSILNTSPIEISGTTRYPNSTTQSSSPISKTMESGPCTNESIDAGVFDSTFKTTTSNPCSSERRQPCPVRRASPVIQPSGLSVTIWLIILVIALLFSYLGSLLAYQVCRKAGYCGCTRDTTVKYVPF